MGRLSQDFFMDDAIEVAKKLLGKILVHETPEGITKCRIVETEAYMGVLDKGSHAYSGKITPRTSTLYEQGGVAYVYLIYGMYHCMNVVVNVKGLAQGVLIRALEPLEGIELMKKRRKMDKVKNLCNGPGKLCIAMDITKKENGVNLMSSFSKKMRRKNLLRLFLRKELILIMQKRPRTFYGGFI